MEFVRGLTLLVTHKMELDVAQLLSSDVLFAHFVDETLAFHRELRSVYSLPVSSYGCLHVLAGAEPFHRWKNIEKKCEPNFWRKRHIFNLHITYGFIQCFDTVVVVVVIVVVKVKVNPSYNWYSVTDPEGWKAE